MPSSDPVQTVSAPTPSPINRPHSQWLATLDDVTRRWAHDVCEQINVRSVASHVRQTAYGQLFADVNTVRRDHGLRPIDLRDV